MNDTKKNGRQNTTRRRAFSIAAGLLFLVGAIAQISAQVPGEFAAGSFATSSGPLTTAQSGRVQLNPSGTTYTTPNTVVSIGASFSNQQYTGVGTGAGNPVVMFGATNTTGGGTVTARPTFANMNDIGSPANTQFSNAANGTASGIDVTTNQAFNMYTSVHQWAGLTTPSTSNSRIYMGDLTLTFSTPLKNPLLHIVGMGGTSSGLGFSTELDLTTPGISLSKIQGNAALTVSAAQINNSNATGITASCSGGGAACGTIQVTGSGITSVTFKVYVRGDGGNADWGSAANHAGDQWLMGFSMPETFTVAGNVFNDANGLSDATVNGTSAATFGGVPLYANLIDANGNVLGSQALGANGDYSFNGIPAGASLRVEISTLAGTALSTAPAITLPSGWVSTGENIGTSAGNDGTANGTININNITADVSNANFGIEERPVANTNTAASQTNPGGTNSAAVPATTFSATDAAPGIVANIRITAFPSNATSITINGTQYTSGTFPAGGVTVPTNAAGNPTQPILVDPINGATTVAISYVALDNAGVVSSAAATANVPFAVISLSGTVFNDVNGLTDNTVNGTGTNAGGPLYVNLVSGGTVVQSTLLPANGAYSFNNLSVGSYTVVVSTNQGTVGAAAPAAALPSGWVNTGEFLGAVAGNDGSANGALAVSIGTATTGVTNANFGIEQRPTVTSSAAPSQTNPGGTNRVTVPAATFIAGDLSTGVVSNIRIAAFPSNATSLTVGTATYYPNAGSIPAVCPTATCAAFPAGGLTVPTNASGSPTQTVQVDPLNGAVTVGIVYFAIDDANVESAASATASVPFATVSLGGAVFNDTNGLTDTLVNGTVPNTGATLYANLLDINGIVLQSTAVSSAGGLYSFANLDSGSYTVQLSTNPGTVGSAAPAKILPNGWVNTGEFVGAGAGNDGTVNGLLPVTVAAVSIVSANFGIEERPVANNNTAASRTNPGGTTNATVPATTFSGTDTAGVANIRITAFPSNATSITINGTQYTAGNFPAGGVTVPTNAAGNPTQAILVDPIDGATTVVIRYVAIDAAGVVSSPDASAATANIPFVLAPTAGEITVGGRVVTASGRGISRARVSLTDAGGNVRYALTNSFGNYRFTNVAAGENIVVGVKDKRYTFDNPAQIFSASEDRADINFVGRLSERAKESKTDDASRAPFDFDGDNRTDVAVYRPSNQTWYILLSATGTLRVEQFAADAGAQIAPADYDGDGIADMAVYNNESKVWTVLKSSNGEMQSVVGFGAQGEATPAAADYDGDGKADFALESNGELEIRQSSNGETVRQASESLVRENRAEIENGGVIILRGDFDGDGQIDAATFDKGLWNILTSGDSQANQISFGSEGDVPAPSAFLPKAVKSKKENR